MSNHVLPEVLALLILLSGVPYAAAAEEASLDPNLEPLRPFIGKTWRGVFKNAKADKPMVDVARWERALNGKAIRILHSINDGVYGGESIVTWDKEKQSIVYHYFTTAGFMTVGTVKVSDGKLTTHETVSGNAGSATEVRATTTLPRDGAYEVMAEYLVKGKWELGREANYKEDPAAKVVFK